MWKKSHLLFYLYEYHKNDVIVLWQSEAKIHPCTGRYTTKAISVDFLFFAYFQTF